MRIYLGGGIHISTNCKECDKEECPHHLDYVEPIDMTKNGDGDWEAKGVPMNIVEAKLIKTVTDDGFMELHDDIPIGKIYRVDLDQIEMVKGFNVPTRQFWEKEMIYAEDPKGHPGWMPLELFEIKELKERPNGELENLN